MSVQDFLKEKEVVEIKKKECQSKKIYVQNIFIDQNYIQKWGLKTTQDGKRNYWQVLGDFYISKNHPNKPWNVSRSSMIGFRINLSTEKTFEADEVEVDDYDLNVEAVEDVKDVLKIDLKEKIDNFIKAFKNHAVYNVYRKGSWNDETMDWKGWIELKVQKNLQKISLLQLPVWIN